MKNGSQTIIKTKRQTYSLKLKFTTLHTGREAKQHKQTVNLITSSTICGKFITIFLHKRNKFV